MISVFISVSVNEYITAAVHGNAVCRAVAAVH